ncbi:DNA glycosylase [Leucosporidium creatinivorum]|uniref:DNA-(apurinic or apyrimidinic site) lyase n=1 Tax=Leucosporidium creatinivorum TaxID=106004 RepID=A0A1Y2EM44_9BASI|nr:DNA glycosylase [Leucosporidium creatinivorum]
MIPLSTPLRFLPLLPSELQLATVLKSGQSFRWARFDTVHASKPDVAAETAGAAPGAEDSKPALEAKEQLVQGEEWAFGWGDRTVVLRQDSQGIHYRSLYPPIPPYAAYAADLKSDTTLPLLKSYFQLDTPLAPLYAEWAAKDAHFKKKVEAEGERLEGIRVLNQDPWECLISFICSANNNISRITLMVNRVCESLGAPLPHPTSFHPSTIHTLSSLSTLTPLPSPPSTPVLYAFPPPSALTPSSTDPLLRELGFGYRAPFIEWSANYLVDLAEEQKTTPLEYLESLRKGKFDGDLGGAREKLMEFKGVGRKVADCVALFSLGWKETVPVDTHVFQIAIRDYSFPSSKTTALTPVLHDRVCARLQTLWGPHAGWAQQVLFFADLKPSSGSASPSPSPKKRSGSTTPSATTTVVRNKFEEELKEIMENPGKRRRVSVKVELKEESGSESEGKVTKAVKKSGKTKKAAT